MGYTSYNLNDRATRAVTMDWANASVGATFKQTQEKKIHESMIPAGITFREARDSSTHPNTVPIILALDVTGSMHRIPHHMVKEGLPKLMGNIIEHGIPDPALLFIAIGDAKVDDAPLQVGQFESGDAELDTWLTNVWPEGGGGGNGGESYLLTWYFAAKHTKTDADEKRHEKGFLFTVGDEPCHPRLEIREVKDIMAESAIVGEKPYTAAELLAAAQEKWNVYHLHVMEGSDGSRSLDYWKDLLGERCIEIKDYKKIPDKMVEIITKGSTPIVSVATPAPATSSTPHEEML